MSDRELRQVLRDVIEDMDAGRLSPFQRIRGRALRGMLVGSALAAGLALGGCRAESLYGAPPTDAYGVPMMDARPDTGPVDAYGIPSPDASLDAGVTADASADAGPTEDYGAPDVDAGPQIDDGGVFLYGAPPQPDEDDEA